MYENEERCEKMKRKTKTKIILITVMTLLQIFAFYNNSLATSAPASQQTDENPISNPNYYLPGGISGGHAPDAGKLEDKANVIIGAIQIIGTILSVVVLGIIGIKYMIGSAEERAEYKKTLQPYLIGAIMLFGITNILAIVVKIVNQLLKIQLGV